MDARADIRPKNRRNTSFKRLGYVDRPFLKRSQALVLGFTSNVNYFRKRAIADRSGAPYSGTVRRRKRQRSFKVGAWN